jgi:hypothetical protein
MEITTENFIAELIKYRLINDKDFAKVLFDLVCQEPDFWSIYNSDIEEAWALITERNIKFRKNSLMVE